MQPGDSDSFSLPSKSQRKRDATALQKLGESLTAYSPAQLGGLPVTPEVVSAIEEYQQLPKSHGARKRQLQYIGKLMRKCDLQEVTRALADLQMARPIVNTDDTCRATARSILANGREEIQRAVARWPALDRQRLSQWERSYRSAQEEERPRIEKKLQQYLREAMADAD